MSTVRRGLRVMCTHLRTGGFAFSGGRHLEHLLDEFLGANPHFHDARSAHVTGRRDDLVHRIDHDFIGLRVPMCCTHLSKCGSRVRIGSYRKLDMMVRSQDARDKRGSDAKGTNRLALRVQAAEEPRNRRINLALGPVLGKGAEVLGCPKAAGYYQTVQIRVGYCSAVGDFPARYASRLLKYVPALAAGLPRCVIHNIALPFVGRDAHDLGTVFGQKIERESCFVNFAAVENSTTGKQNADLFSHISPMSGQV